MVDFKVSSLVGVKLSTGLIERRAYWQCVLKYYYLTKPGIVYSNVMMGVSGYLFAGHFKLKLVVLVGLLAGMALIIASACILNNYLDQGIDSKMQRTKQRALVTGAVSPTHAIVLATSLGLGGFALLTLTNEVTLIIGGVAFISYVVIYGLAKRRSVHGTLVGTVPGAATLVAGYAAYRGRLDMVALWLFLIMLCWQMAHFYAIATYRLDDYKRAKLPVWPAVRGVNSTKQMISFYISLFIVCNFALWLSSKAGSIYIMGVGALGLVWLWKSLAGFHAQDEALWARQIFGFSLLVLLSLAFLLPLSTVLP